ncbi:type II toxin-antitoxin system RelE/ParE family toxin [Bradyrhizobium sp. 33ap4]|uniref:type II toxin-antitoxin system RelE/ParE family toxin n=1 Tax=Bradyrhizobium sp. 33ap4 TaxID=3061630 RepID=UPI00292D5A9B|nr:type II toxin-antitoxin system RelE/ParE family toxin [Bradyrhizobium sp. 33ap4]
MTNSKSAIKSSERKEDVPLEFVGSSLEDLSAFPLPCKKEIGFALRAAQKGGKGENVKPLKGFGGASVLQIKSSFDGDTFRAVYTVQLKGAIYVLHAFQKKSTKGKTTSQNDKDLIRTRLNAAIELHAEKENEQSKKHKRQR